MSPHREQLSAPSARLVRIALGRSESTRDATVEVEVLRVPVDGGDSAGTASTADASDADASFDDASDPDASDADENSGDADASLVAFRELAGQESELALPLALDDWLVLRGERILARCVHVDARSLLAGEIEIPVDAASILSGQIVDSENGASVAAAQVAADLDPVAGDVPAAVRRRLLETQLDACSSDRDGRFELPVAVGGPLHVRCSAAGYCPIECVEVLPDGRPLVLTMVPSCEADGRVVDLTGKPIAGADLAVGRLGAIPVEEHAIARTDAHGLFASDRLPRTHVALIARADGHAPARLELDLRRQAGRGLEIVLHPATPLRGRVVDEEGRPIAGADVLVGSLTDHLVVGTNVSAEDGSFEMPWTRVGERYHVQLDAEGYDPSDVGPLELPSGPVTFRMQARGVVRLRAIDEEGAAIGRFRLAHAAEVESEIHDEYWWQTAEWTEVRSPDGRTDVLALRRLPHRILVVAEGFAPAQLRVSPAGPQDAGRVTEVVLGRGARFSGTVADRCGAPIAGARVGLATRASFGSRRSLPTGPDATTDGAGGFALDVDSSHPLDLVVVREGFAPALFVDLDPASPSPVLRWPAVGAIEGRVLVFDRTALASICVRAEVEDSGAFVEMRPGPDGTFRFDGIPCGPTRVRLVDEWASSQWHTFAVQERLVVVPSSGSIDVSFDLSDARVLEGRLELPRELASVRFEVLAEPAEPADPTEPRGDRPRVTSTVELSGRFVLSGLTPGRWTVEAISRSAGTLVSARAEVDVERSRPTPPLRLAPDCGARTLRIVAAEGARPLPDAWLELLADAGAVRSRIEADERGRVEVIGVAADRPWRARVRAAGFAAALVELAAGAEALEVSLHPEARLELTLESPDPTTLEDAFVTLATADGARESRLAAAALTFAQLPAGALEIRVAGKQELASWSGVLAAGQTFRLQLAISSPGRLVARVEDARGEPLPHRLVTLEAGDDGKLRSLETAFDGRVEFEAPAGSATVRCGGASTEVEIPAGRTVEVTLRGE